MVLDSSINNISFISWQTIFYSGGGVVGFWRLTPVSTIFQLYHGKLYFTGGKAMVLKAFQLLICRGGLYFTGYIFVHHWYIVCAMCPQLVS